MCFFFCRHICQELSFCLSLYGCSLRSMSCENLRIIECAFNRIFRKVWNLPSRSHTRIVHCVTMFNQSQITFFSISPPCYHVLCHPCHLSSDVSSVTLLIVDIPLLTCIYKTLWLSALFLSRYVVCRSYSQLSLN